MNQPKPDEEEKKQKLQIGQRVMSQSQEGISELTMHCKEQDKQIYELKKSNQRNQTNMYSVNEKLMDLLEEK